MGHLAEMYKAFPAMCARGAAAHGPLFWIQGGPGAKQLMYTSPAAIAVLKHPQVSSSFYTEGFSALLGNTLMAFDGEQHRSVRQVLTPPFTPQRVRRSDALGIVVSAVQARLDTWPSLPEIDIVAETREVALEIIFRMVGTPVSRLPEWRKQYDRYLFAGLPSRGRFRGPIYWYAKRARDWIDQQLGAIVDELRRSGDTTTMAGAVANGRTEDGALLDRDLVICNLRLLIFAGHETTASSVAWVAIHLASSLDHQRRLLAEVEGDADLTELATGDKLTFAESLFREALRLYPAVHSAIRRVTGEVELTEGTIPKGTLLNIPFVHLLRDPARFPNPDHFDPDRWIERPRPGTVETAMFGGGPHFCLGYHVAIAEGTLFTLLLARAMATHGLELRRTDAGPVPAPVYLPLTHPPRSLRLVLVKRR